MGENHHKSDVGKTNHRGNRGALLWSAMGNGPNADHNETPRTSSIHKNGPGIRTEFLMRAIQGTPRQSMRSSSGERSAPSVVPHNPAAHPQHPREEMGIARKRGMRGDLLKMAFSRSSGAVINNDKVKVVKEGWVEMSQKSHHSSPGWVSMWAVCIFPGFVMFYHAVDFAKPQLVANLQSSHASDMCETELSSPLMIKLEDTHGDEGKDGNESQEIILRLKTIERKKQWLSAFRMSTHPDSQGHENGVGTAGPLERRRYSLPEVTVPLLYSSEEEEIEARNLASPRSRTGSLDSPKGHCVTSGCRRLSLKDLVMYFPS